MNKKGVGAIFCLISAILFAARSLTAATYFSSTPSWSGEDFQRALEYIGPGLLIASIVALVLGACFLIFGLLTDEKK